MRTRAQTTCSQLDAAASVIWATITPRNVHLQLYSSSNDTYQNIPTQIHKSCVYNHLLHSAPDSKTSFLYKRHELCVCACFCLFFPSLVPQTTRVGPNTWSIAHSKCVLMIVYTRVWYFVGTRHTPAYLRIYRALKTAELHHHASLHARTQFKIKHFHRYY